MCGWIHVDWQFTYPTLTPWRIAYLCVANMDSQETFAWAEEMKFPTSKMTTWVKIYLNVLGPSAFCSFFFSGEALLGSLLQQERVRTNNRIPCFAYSLSREGACTLDGAGVGVCPRVNQKGWLGVVWPPLWRGWVQGTCSVPCFCSWFFRSGCRNVLLFFVFLDIFLGPSI